ncbi:aspartate kinase [Paenibacillus sacheonensis]|uniref:Aspartokinase n=1 Tax=Paenibacillus sacheonensis TaxID=742054 RepID=A0A7X5C0F6_9BACL|nr:aspartate kinase [Paenibacillus sacheonensis]MBM7564669.1 aspartate kinase [Paenibacillus sacheonensis]NBC69225.1 aspartate kinase [Paenibacillus sacheonensis]
MRILVQKFGGTSLSSDEGRQLVIKHIQRERQRQYGLVVVVSAMGRKGDPYATDTLLALIAQHGDSLPAKEKDMLQGCGEIISASVLCSLLRARDIPAVALTGGGAGIITDHQFGKARILEIRTERMHQALREGHVVIVTGFQGVTESGDFTTLGRGGSDTSATALGAALHAERVDIYTDVNGILTADPRIVKDARALSVISYSEVGNMARQGAKVIHPRAVEIAQQARIPIRVRSTFSEDEGTLVTDLADVLNASSVRDRHVTGVAHVSGVTQITVQAQEGPSDVQLQVFQAMAKHHISVDFINVNPGGAVYTVFDHDADKAVTVLQEIGYMPKAVNGCAKISVIGGGMNGVPGIMARIVEALTEQGIPILQSADSNTTIWVLVQESDMAIALQALHAKFSLHE